MTRFTCKMKKQAKRRMDVCRWVGAGNGCFFSGNMT